MTRNRGSQDKFLYARHVSTNVTGNFWLPIWMYAVRVFRSTLSPDAEHSTLVTTSTLFPFGELDEPEDELDEPEDELDELDGLPHRCSTSQLITT